MLFKPQDKNISRHIDYYWIVDDASMYLNNNSYLYAFPGITPDMIIVIDGSYEFEYKGKFKHQNKSRLFSFIHEGVVLNFSNLRSFILVKFKSRALGSLKPFVHNSTEEIMCNPFGFSESAFGGTISQLAGWLIGLSKNEKVSFLDNWFLSYYKKEREGFVIEIAQDISENYDLKEIMAATNYSYSTIERYFKRETGLTPKKYQCLRRFKATVTDILATKNDDWMHYVSTYNYYDQAHFIKDIKKYTRFTPSQLLTVPSFVNYRPDCDEILQ
jgi:AraC-like DNA-binding protein